MLLQNKSFLACNGLRYLAGAPAVSGVLSRNDLGGTINTKKNRYIGEANMYKGDATPSGYTPTGGAWYPNRKAGGLSSRYSVTGSGEINNSSIAGGINTTVTMTGTGTIVSKPYMQIADYFTVDVLSLLSSGTVSTDSSLSGIITFKIADNIILTGNGTIPDVLLRILAWNGATVLGDSAIAVSTKFLSNIIAEMEGTGRVEDTTLNGYANLLSSILATGECTTNLTATANLLADIVGSGNIPDVYLKILSWFTLEVAGNSNVEGGLSLISAMSSILVGSGEVELAVLLGLVYLFGNITAEGELDPTLNFPSHLVAGLHGNGSIEETVITAISWCVSTILSNGQATGNINGPANMESVISSEGELLTAQSCARAVWESISSVFNTAGTMGNKMNSASAAGDPWTAEIPGEYTEGSAGHILKKIEKIIKDNQALILAK